MPSVVGVVIVAGSVVVVAAAAWGGCKRRRLHAALVGGRPLLQEKSSLGSWAVVVVVGEDGDQPLHKTHQPAPRNSERALDMAAHQPSLREQTFFYEFPCWE